MASIDEWEAAGAEPVEDVEERPTWAPVDLAAVLDGSLVRPVLPMLFLRDDGQGLFYRGRINALYGESGSMKSWVAQAAAAAVLRAGGRVVYVDFEDDAAGVTGRMRSLGISVEALVERFAYIRPRDPIAAPMARGQWAGVTAEVEALRATVDGADMVVSDGVNVGMELHGWSMNSADAFSSFVRFILRPAADAGAAVVTIDHQTKARDERRGMAIGTQAKKAQVRGAAYEVIAYPVLAPGREGRARLMCHKDTPGQVLATLAATDKLAATVVFEASEDGGAVAVEVLTVASPVPAAERASARPTIKMEQASIYIENHDGCGREEIVNGVGGAKDKLRRAIDILIAEEYVSATEHNTRQSHTSIRTPRTRR